MMNNNQLTNHLFMELYFLYNYTMRTSKLLLGIFLIAILASVNLLACSDGNEQNELNPNPSETPTITIDSSLVTNGLVFGPEESERSVSFTTNTDWTLNIASTTGGQHGVRHQL